MVLQLKAVPHVTYQKMCFSSNICCYISSPFSSFTWPTTAPTDHQNVQFIQSMSQKNKLPSLHISQSIKRWQPNLVQRTVNFLNQFQCNIRTPRKYHPRTDRHLDQQGETWEKAGSQSGHNMPGPSLWTEIIFQVHIFQSWCIGLQKSESLWFVKALISLIFHVQICILFYFEKVSQEIQSLREHHLSLME